MQERRRCAVGTHLTHCQPGESCKDNRDAETNPEIGSPYLLLPRTKDLPTCPPAERRRPAHLPPSLKPQTTQTSLCVITPIHYVNVVRYRMHKSSEWWPSG